MPRHSHIPYHSFCPPAPPSSCLPIVLLSGVAFAQPRTFPRSHSAQQSTQASSQGGYESLQSGYGLRHGGIVSVASSVRDPISYPSQIARSVSGFLEPSPRGSHHATLLSHRKGVGWGGGGRNGHLPMLLLSRVGYLFSSYARQRRGMENILVSGNIRVGGGAQTRARGRNRR